MGRRKWSEIEGLPPADSPQKLGPAQVPWPVTEEVVIRCPVCGLIVSEKEISRNGEPVGILSGPYAIKVGLRSFGGSFSKTEKRRKGFIGYVWNWQGQPAELEKWQAILKGKLQEAIEEFGA